MAAARHDGAVAGDRRNTDEHGLEPEGADSQTHFIVLGHAGGDERPPAFRRRQPGQGATLDGAADPGQRDRCAHRLADDQLLAVALGELIANGR